MPWLKLVWRIGRFKVLRGPGGELFVQWGSAHLRRLPSLRRLAH